MKGVAAAALRVAGCAIVGGPSGPNAALVEALDRGLAKEDTAVQLRLTHIAAGFEFEGFASFRVVKILVFTMAPR